MIYTNNKKMQMSGKEKQAFMDKIEKKREQQRIRSARFYTNHKDKVLEKHKQNRIKEREILTKLEQEIATQFKAKKSEQPPTAQLQKNEPLPKNTFDYTQLNNNQSIDYLIENKIRKLLEMTESETTMTS